MPNTPPYYQRLPGPPEPEDDEIVVEDEETDGVSLITRKRAILGALLGGAALLTTLGFTRCWNEPRAFSDEELALARAKKTEMGNEAALMKKYGGETYTMRRLPDMAEKHPKAKGNVYIRVPEKKDQKRLLVFLHGNGEQNFASNTITNVIECAKKLDLPMIAPQDGWGNVHPEKKNKLPGNWEDFNDTGFLTTLVGFAESRMGSNADEIYLGSFSGGNIAVTKILRALETSDNSEAKDLYDRITRIAFFDSVTSEETPYVARWMDENSDARVFSYYNRDHDNKVRQYFRDGNRTYAFGNDFLRKALEEKKIDSSRFQIEPLPKELRGHGVFPTKCEEYLKAE